MPSDGAKAQCITFIGGGSDLLKGSAFLMAINLKIQTQNPVVRSSIDLEGSTESRPTGGNGQQQRDLRQFLGGTRLRRAFKGNGEFNHGIRIFVKSDCGWPRSRV